MLLLAIDGVGFVVHVAERVGAVAFSVYCAEYTVQLEIVSAWWI